MRFLWAVVLGGEGVGRVFISTYESGIDAKGRVSIPAAFRAALGGADRLFVWPALDGDPCLECSGPDLMMSYQQILARMNPQDPVRKAFTHALFGKSADLKIDDTGRIKLPEALMERAGLEKQVKFSGAADRFRIWSPERWAAHDADMSAQAAANFDKLEKPFQATLAAGLLPGMPGLGGGGES